MRGVFPHGGVRLLIIQYQDVSSESMFMQATVKEIRELYLYIYVLIYTWNNSNYKQRGHGFEREWEGWMKKRNGRK